MTIQSEAGLENNLINQLESEGYERIILKDESDLEYNFKKQLEKFNKTTFSDSEFKKILIHLSYHQYSYKLFLYYYLTFLFF